MDTGCYLIFAMPSQLQILINAKCYLCDGTCKIVSSPFEQMWSNHAFIHKGYSIKQVPLVFYLMSRLKTKDYVAVFQKLKEVILGVPQVEGFVMDFEKGAWKAVCQEFPKTLIKGCVFYFNQAVQCRTQELGLKTTYDMCGPEYRYVRSLTALPFLPAADIQPVFDLLEPRANSTELQQLVHYIYNNWLLNSVWHPRNWNVFQQSIRINNDVEGRHNRIKRYTGKANLTFYVLVSLLRHEANLVNIQQKLLCEGQIMRLQCTRCKEMESQLHQYEAEYTKSETVMAGIETVIKTLLHGQAVVISNVDVNFNKDLKAHYVPITKQTIRYIVMAVVINDEGKVLFIQEAKQSCYGKWYLPAGRMESGENIVDGVKREVLEESGLEFEPITLIAIEMNGAMWHRFIFTGKVTGGKLKTELEKDTESLQAQWFSPQQIKDREMPLRASDILQPISIGFKHHSLKVTHPNCLPAIAPHKHLIHRPLIVRERQDGTVDVLVYKDQEPHIPSCVIDSRDHSPLLVSVFNILQDAFGRSSEAVSPTICGLLSLEHCGRPAEEHDGMCYTTLVQIEKSQQGFLETPTNTNYEWYSVSSEQLKTDLRNRLKEGMTIPILSF